ncbi:MAG: substrate-binding domain-containing protein [Sphingomonas sp.]
MLRRLALLALCAGALASCDETTSREIRVVGSSTVYPFTTAVAEAFVNKGGGRKAPVIESIGTGAGIKRFCDGVGSQFPDIANASRRMKRSEFDLCQQNGVGEILEIQIGLDGVALAESNKGPKLALTRKDIYLALAANPMGQPNTAKTWKDVNPALPPVPISVMGPPSTSGTRDAFAELILEPGCLEAVPEGKAMKNSGDPAKFENLCRRIRDDGPYVDKGENDNLIVQAFRKSQCARHLRLFLSRGDIDRLHGVPIGGVAPTYETIAKGSYPGARPLYLYVKKRHLRAVPGLQEFLELYARMWAQDGELAKRGLIAMSKTQRDNASEVIRLGIALDPSGLQ